MICCVATFLMAAEASAKKVLGLEYAAAHIAFLTILNAHTCVSESGLPILVAAEQRAADSSDPEGELALG